MYPVPVAISALGRDPAEARGGHPHPRKSFKNKTRQPWHILTRFPALCFPSLKCLPGWVPIREGAVLRFPATARHSSERRNGLVSPACPRFRGQDRKISLREAAEGTGAKETQTAGREYLTWPRGFLSPEPSPGRAGPVAREAAPPPRQAPRPREGTQRRRPGHFRPRSGGRHLGLLAT